MSASVIAIQRMISFRICSNRERVSPYPTRQQNAPLPDDRREIVYGFRLHTLAPRSATRRCVSVSASMMSRSASACVRSSRPPLNARRVNSPRSAGRRRRGFSIRPGVWVALELGSWDRRDSAVRIDAKIARPEWTCSSRTSSVVNEFGPMLRVQTATICT